MKKFNLQILDHDYNIMIPQPRMNAVAVFNMEGAKEAFMYSRIDFVIALNESTNTFGYCNNLSDCDNFYGQFCDTDNSNV